MERLTPRPDSVWGMDATSPTPHIARMVRPTWVWGGICLAASAVPGLLWQAIAPLGVTAVVAFVADALWCAALVLFAIGRDSIVARRIGGTIVLCALAVWPLLVRVVAPMIPLLNAPVDRDNEDAKAIVWISLQLVPVVLAVIAVVLVWRAAAIPRIYRFMPLIALVLCVVPPLGQYAAGGILLSMDTSALFAYGALMLVCRTVALIGLGVVAIVAGLQPRATAPVPVYSSSGD